LGSVPGADAELERDEYRSRAETFRKQLERVLTEWYDIPEPTRAEIAAALTSKPN
jgi:hypothetical protein